MQYTVVNKICTQVNKQAQSVYILIDSYGRGMAIPQEKLLKQVQQGNIQLTNVTISHSGTIRIKTKPENPFMIQKRMALKASLGIPIELINGLSYSVAKNGVITCRRETDPGTSHVVVQDGTNYIGNGSFLLCNSKSVSLPNTLLKISANAFASSEIAKIDIPDSVLEIEERAFNFAKNLKSIRLSGNLLKIGAEAFFTSGLQTVSIPDSIKYIDRFAFSMCRLLKTVQMPKHTDCLELQLGIFQSCTRLEKINLPDGLRGIPSSAFYGCESLKSIYIPESVDTIGANAFYGCKQLSKLDLPSTMTQIGLQAFCGCVHLTTVWLPEGADIGPYAFQLCTGLERVRLPQGLKCIREGTFYGCSSLTRVEIPDSVTAIQNSAFQGCTSLRFIRLPRGLVDFAPDAFVSCKGLKEVLVPSTYGHRNTSTLHSRLGLSKEVQIRIY